jgi:1-deoxy-D-xylulose-5-phosphate reductoisomerase
MDSEHSAIFQVLHDRDDVENLTLTASGGPFLNTPIEQLASMGVAQARAHPRWSMGLKISIDSATMMNKALEVIEAAYLFEKTADEIEVVVHPQSIIHSMVSYSDGSVLAQLGTPDMRTPIAYALAWPQQRVKTEVERLDLAALSRLDFQHVNNARFPAISYAKHALRAGGCAPLILNCANEAAVAAFIAGECRFTDISLIVEKAIERFSQHGFEKYALLSFEEIAGLHKQGYELARNLLGELQV